MRCATLCVGFLDTRKITLMWKGGKMVHRGMWYDYNRKVI